MTSKGRRGNSWAQASLLAGVALLMQGCGGGGNSSAASTAAADVTPANIMPAVACASLQTLQIPNTTIVTAQAISSGSYQPSGSATAFANLPAFCRVTATVKPVAGSSISIELWLPSAGWNGRYQQVGTHGFGGTIYWNEMAPQLQRGFVTGSSDSGHANTGNFDASWAFGNPERVTDFAWRAVHELAVSAKQLIQAYYGRAASYSYHNGCSTGGREGMISAQMFPNDFNGILAGGALQNLTHVATQELFVNKQLLQSGFQASTAPALLTLAHNAAVAACDGLDGVVDGIIRDPRTCSFDPHALVCAAGQDPATCLTAAQADALAASTAPLRDPVTQQTVFAGQTADSQLDWIKFGYANGPFIFPLSIYRIGLNDPTWDSSTFNLHTDLPAIEQTMGSTDATQADLSAFKAAGGKLMQFHGWADGVTVPSAIVDYYDQVRDRTSSGDRSAQLGFYRLFMLPGVSHCGGGAGPYNFGQEGQTPVSNDAEHDAVTALQAWVERGVAPQQLVATKFKNDDPAQGIAMQRPVCSYPLQATYKGSGDTNSADSFECR